jgi:hypothetical protein
MNILAITPSDRPFGFSFTRKGCMGYSDAREVGVLTTPTVDDMVTGGDIPNNRAVRFEDLSDDDLDRPVETAQ